MKPFHVFKLFIDLPNEMHNLNLLTWKKLITLFCRVVFDFYIKFMKIRNVFFYFTIIRIEYERGASQLLFSSWLL